MSFNRFINLKRPSFSWFYPVTIMTVKPKHTFMNGFCTCMELQNFIPVQRICFARASEIFLFFYKHELPKSAFLPTLKQRAFRVIVYFSLQCFEKLIIRCSASCCSFVGLILKVSLKLLPRRSHKIIVPYIFEF